MDILIRSMTTNPVRIVQVHDIAPLAVYVLVALALASHGQRGIHVHVVAGKVQANQELEDHGPSRHCRGQEY